MANKDERSMGKVKKQGDNDIRKPARWLYRSALRILQLPMLLLFGIRIFREPCLKKINGPIIVLGNHPSYLDPFLAALALPFWEINFVAASLFFRNRRLKPILELLGVIPKVQFRSDATALKRMLKVLKSEGVLGIFPEGQRSLDGTANPFDDTIAKLIKKTCCHVVFLKINGAYLTWPRWSAHGMRPGRIEIRADLLLTPEQTESLTADEIAAQLKKTLSFNDYEWQHNRRKKASYFHVRPAENMHNICHQCPVCKTELSMRAKNNKIVCDVCHMGYRIDRHGFLFPLADGQTDISDVHAWRVWQQDMMKQRIKQSGFSLEFSVETQTAGVGEAFAGDGAGQLVIDRSGLFYTGIDRQGQKVEFVSPAGKTARFSADYGLNLEIPHDRGSFRFFPDPGQAVILLADALALLDNGKSEQ